jgi:hypothetical protein
MDRMDFIDFCCPSKSRSVIELDDVQKYSAEEEKGIIVETINDVESDSSEKSTNQVKILMDKLMEIREDLKNIPNVSSREKSQLSTTLLLLRGEVSNMKLKERSDANRFKLSLPKSLPRLRFEKGLRKKSAKTQEG